RQLEILPGRVDAALHEVRGRLADRVASRLRAVAVVVASAVVTAERDLLPDAVDRGEFADAATPRHRVLIMHVGRHGRGRRLGTLFTFALAHGKRLRNVPRRAASGPVP